MKRVRLSNKEVKELAASLGKLGEILKNADVVEVGELEGGRVIYIVDKIPALYRAEVQGLGEVIIPTLYLVHKSPMGQGVAQLYPRLVVDAGAVKHILNGADVMRPGIKRVEGDFDKGQPVLIEDEKGRIIAIGISLYSRKELEAMEKGKTVYNAHYLGDKLWKLSLELANK